MILVVYSETYKGALSKRLGESEYSYYFVLKEFRPVLERIGMVVAVGDPAHEVDAIRRNARTYGHDTIFLSFTPPHQTEIGLECPTYPVFAWEFDSLPSEVWDGNARNDWRTTFCRVGHAITHSNFTVGIVKAAMGQDFPIVSIPAPVWDRFDALYRRNPPRPICPGIDIVVKGTVVDTAAPDFDPTSRRLPDPAEAAPLHLEGVIYTSVFNPRDGRKNWHEMMCAFVLTLREQADATLIFKLTHHDPELAFEDMLKTIYRLTPFKCRILLILGYLDDPDYERMVDATSFALNASAGEGQCLPLMEFMSAGKPAIASRNTALLDYVSDENSFPVESSLEPWCWPHDPRQAFRTRRHRIDFSSLMRAYDDSYRMAKDDPARYARMSQAANRDLKAHCAQDVIEARLREFLNLPRLP
jgi:glycosyltransferase involved in cell wall biosynthesis